MPHITGKCLRAPSCVSSISTSGDVSAGGGITILIGQSEASGDALGASFGDALRQGITRGGAGGHA